MNNYAALVCYYNNNSLDANLLLMDRLEILIIHLGGGLGNTPRVIENT